MIYTIFSRLKSVKYFNNGTDQTYFFVGMIFLSILLKHPLNATFIKNGNSLTLIFFQKLRKHIERYVKL